MKHSEAPSCPRCNSSGDVKKLAYGLIAMPNPNPPVRDGYTLGSCCIRPDSPEWYCGACAESFGTKREYWGKPLTNRIQ